MTAHTPSSLSNGLVNDLRQLIESARQQAAVSVNAALTVLYWRMGERIQREILGGQRASYGEAVLKGLGQQLSSNYGRGFSGKNLHHMVRFAEAFPDEAIVSTLSRQLSWSHLKQSIEAARLRFSGSATNKFQSS